MGVSKEVAVLRGEREDSNAMVLSLPPGIRVAQPRDHGLLKPRNDLFGFVDSVCDDFLKNSSPANRKKRGQFFTPKEVASFMAGLFELDTTRKSFRLLDAGAGIGMLSVAFCHRVSSLKHNVFLHVDAYENDPEVIPYLRSILGECKILLENSGHTMTFDVTEKDFVVENPNFLKSRTLFGPSQQGVTYDFVISNPPYYKLNKDSVEAGIMKEFVSGQPNIYAFFMALSLEMLRPDGQMVFITPRSFCSGLYFQRFRKWLLRNGQIRNLHVFESRKDVFAKMDVLQENIIIRLTPATEAEKYEKARKVLVSSSRDSAFLDTTTMPVDYEDVLHRKNGDIFIKVPSSKLDIEVQHVMNSWKSTIEGLGLKASTGPVVSFRAKEFLDDKPKNISVPLLWMHNLKGFDVVWPVDKRNKPGYISAKESSKQLLLSVKNYVLVKRFTSKEQNRRLYAAVMQKESFDYEQIGLENHLNYIYKANGELSLDEAFGLAALLNTSLVDTFFRMMNGNTQVNVIDIHNLPFPPIEKIREVGKLVRQKKLCIGSTLDKEVLGVLGIDHKIFKTLNRE